MALFTRDIGIDLGTTGIRMAVKGKGLVLSEPSVVALDEHSHTIIALGKEAQKMQGRTPRGITVVSPVRGGVISDFDLTERMIHYYIRQVMGHFAFFRPRVVVSVPAGISEVERRSVVEVTMEAGASDTRLMLAPVAAAIGAGLDMSGAGGTMVVNVGAGVTNVAILSMNSPVLTDSFRIAGDELDESIVRYMKAKHTVTIGKKTAEEVKIQIGVASPEPAVGDMNVSGRNLVSNLPLTIHLTAAELCDAVEATVASIVEGIHVVLEHMPPEIASDIFERGITLTGGGALLTGLPRRISTALHIPCHIAENALDCVALGIGQALEDLDKYGELIQDYRKPFRYDFKRG